ncbi:MAG TPA: hypothetical protein VHB97_15000 [Polyangia bacterium]|nr:hypothetical protein [Polyangia bacterium]
MAEPGRRQRRPLRRRLERARHGLVAAVITHGNSSSPNELVQAIAAGGATSSGAATSLITFPKNTDPGVRVLGDANYAYAVAVDYYAGTSSIMP